MTNLDEILNNIKADEEPVADFVPIEKKVDQMIQPKKKEIDYADGDFKTEEDRKNIRIRFAKGKQRKEQKRILGGEKEQIVDKQKMVLGVFAVSIFFLFMLYSYSPGNDALMTIILIIGTTLFIPIGMVIGWMLLDPYNRCKIMRKMTRGRKNYGIVNFVGKANKIVSKIKNFDEDLIWIGNRCWVLAKCKIKEISKNGEELTEGTVIDPTKILAMSETIPILFIDLTSMEPLSFTSEGREKVSPEEIGSFMKGWIDNQMAKIMFLKKTLDIYFIIVIISSLAAAFFGYQNNQAIEELTTEIETLKNMIGGIT